MLKLTTDKHEALRGLSATAELLVTNKLFYGPPCMCNEQQKECKRGKIVLICYFHC